MKRFILNEYSTCIFAMILAALLLPGAFAQQRVNPRQTYERIWMVVPIIGAGTLEDPKRPMYAPKPHEKAPTQHDDILGYTYEASDDGHFALVQFVGKDRSAFAAIISDSNPNVKLFLPWRDKRDAMEAEFLKHKKNFDFKHFGVIAQ